MSKGKEKRSEKWEARMENKIREISKGSEKRSKKGWVRNRSKKREVKIGREGGREGGRNGRSGEDGRIFLDIRRKIRDGCYIYI